jgi:hypothetical protein
VLAVFRGVCAHPGSSLLSGHLSGTVTSKRKAVRIITLGVMGRWRDDNPLSGVLGRTGAEVSVLGYGAMELRGQLAGPASQLSGPAITDEEAGREIPPIPGGVPVKNQRVLLLCRRVVR